MPNKLTAEKRMELLVKNHKEYFNSIVLSFANQYHELMKEIEKDIQSKHWKPTLTTKKELKEDEKREVD